MASETSDLTVCCIFGVGSLRNSPLWIVGLQTGLDQHSRSPDANDWDRHRANGDFRWKTEAFGKHCISDLVGGRSSQREARRDVTMLVIFWELEHQSLSHVYSSSVVRFRSACHGRLAPRTLRCQLCARSERILWQRRRNPHLRVRLRNPSPPGTGGRPPHCRRVPFAAPTFDAVQEKRRCNRRQL